MMYVHYVHDDQVKVGDVKVEVGNSSLGKPFAGAFGKKVN